MTNYLEILNNLSPEEIQRIAQETNAALAGVKFIPFPGTQTQAYFSEADILLYGGQPGGGKGQPETAYVLTPFGWKQIYDLKVGAALCATDGTVQKVLAKHERGVQSVYRLKWSDGSETVCDEDHIWLAWKSGGQKKIANKQTTGEAGARKWITSEIYTYYSERDGAPEERLAIPVITEPCRFNVAGEMKGPHKFIKRDLHPYLLGVLLGDGALSRSTVSWSKPDLEIRDRVQDILGVELSVHEKDNGCPQFTVPNKPTKGQLIDLGLMGLRSEEKFIPRIYLFSTVDERWELARGLMDTDGWCEEDGESYYGTTSKRLADDVRHLMRSLGAVVTVRERDPEFTYKRERKQGQHFYTLRIKIKEPSRLFSLPRKKQRCKDKVFQSMGIYLESIKFIGEEKTVCLEVSHPNSLYITEGFIVTHNSALINGLAIQEHYRSLLVRRNHSDLRPLIDVAKELVGTEKGFIGGGRPEYNKEDGGVIHYMGLAADGGLGGMQGEAHDLIGVDEVAQMTEEPVRTIMGWLRRTTRTPKSQRLRMVMASNPPLDSTGDWLVPFYPCWLDETYPNPAADGELRWFIRDGGVDVECKKGDSVLLDGKEVFAHSRTFIASNYTDNPYIDTQEYAAKLANMPEMQRKILMSGNFLLSRGDAEGQMIPTKWIQMAQARWTVDGEKGRHMVAMGADVTGGGADNTALARLYDGLYFGEMIVKPGVEVGSGNKQAALIIENRRGNCPVGIDMGGGYGGGPKEMLSFSGIDAYAFNPSGATGERTKDRAYGFYNQRALAYWRLRDALDPDADGGCTIALPPSKKLLSDLATPKFTTVMYGGRMVIKMESKDEIKKRIRRSPDEGDAVVIALFVYMKKGDGDGKGGLFGRKGLPRVNIGHEKRKGRRG